MDIETEYALNWILKNSKFKDTEKADVMLERIRKALELLDSKLDI